ncbi:MAG: Ig-like domain-containing protein, partial [Planctomycetota bacterium]
MTLGYSWRDGTGRLFSEAIAGEVADAPPDPVVVAPQDATATIWKDTGRFFLLEDDIVVQDAVNGTVELGENGYVRYTPDPGFVGIDTFEYGFLDGKAPASGDVVYDADATGVVSIEVLDPVADGAVFYAFEKIHLGANPLFDYVDKLPVGAWLPSGGEVASSPLSSNISEAFSSRGYHLSGGFWSFPVAPNGGFLEPEGVALDAVFIEAGKVAPVGSGFEDDADLLMIATNLGGSGELRRYDGPFTFLGSDAADAAPLSGLSGAGTFRLLGGADTLNATFFQSDGITVHAGDGDDRIVGTDGDDLLRGEAGDDDLRGGPGDDVVVPGDGADAVHLGQGDDLLRGTLAELADTRLEDFGIGDAIHILGGASTPFR